MICFENWAYIEGKVAVFKCREIMEYSKIRVEKLGNFEMLNALKKCHKKTSSITKKKSERKGH